MLVAGAQLQIACLQAADSADLAGPLAQKSLASFQGQVAADIQIQADINHRKENKRPAVST